jgi:hypothetical protein
VSSGPAGQLHDDSASALSELLVAAALGLVALSMLGSNVLPAISTLGRAAEPDPVAATLDFAADTVVRVVASARSGPFGPAVTAEGGDLLVRADGWNAQEPARIAIDAGALTMTGAGSAPDSDPTGPTVLVEGLAAQSALELLDRSGALIGHDGVGAVAVRLHLEKDGRTTRRLVRIRGVT